MISLDSCASPPTFDWSLPAVFLAFRSSFAELFVRVRFCRKICCVKNVCQLVNKHSYYHIQWHYPVTASHTKPFYGHFLNLSKQSVIYSSCHAKAFYMPGGFLKLNLPKSRDVLSRLLWSEKLGPRRRIVLCCGLILLVLVWQYIADLDMIHLNTLPQQVLRAGGTTAYWGASSSWSKEEALHEVTLKGCAE